MHYHLFLLNVIEAIEHLGLRLLIFHNLITTHPITLKQYWYQQIHGFGYQENVSMALASEFQIPGPV